MRPAILFLLAATACAQTFSSHSGWSFNDTLQTATDVLVGDIVSGSAVDDGSQVSVKATLRVVRVLGGNTAAGSDVAIQWQYRPMPIESPTRHIHGPKSQGTVVSSNYGGKAAAAPGHRDEARASSDTASASRLPKAHSDPRCWWSVTNRGTVPVIRDHG